ncbi:MAG: 2,3-bisphosphoglycerate-independent phosphoglycerate mutase [Thermaerobacter sp.]|nr:2,3-bisphosphoglycerate-independent phosphoglycerate mutase [Thermaerobacter sp.]
MSVRPRPIVLMVLDGWGVAAPSPVNAINTAPDRRFERLRARYPSTTVAAHGRAVGLMAGQMGDSNVGHLTIGAGRVILQNLPRVFESLRDGSLSQSPALQELVARARGRRLHLMGLLSPGGVHSHQEHLAGLVEILAQAGVKDLALHLWLDGRDVPPQSALGSLEFLAGVINRHDLGRVASLAGRYYAMDRDRRWERTERAYRAMVQGIGLTAESALEAVMEAYGRGESDEFVQPTVMVDAAGRAVAPIGPEDPVLVFNFRADRVRQITRALADERFSEFSRPFPAVGAIAGMTVYDENFVLPHMLSPQTVADNLAEWISKHGLSQLHVAETEKYAHVTFFFNGGVERLYPGEDRVLIPSPKVATYDAAPEMSARAIADTVVEDVKAGRHDFVLLNFANSDMVGHTGKLEPTQQAIRVVDEQIERIARTVLDCGGALIIVADHGNAEIMVAADGQPHTNHTTNPVPFVVIGADAAMKGRKLASGGGLRDVAPTVLELMGLPVPAEMTGESLLRPERVAAND